MSNEIDDLKMNINSSFDSQDIENKSPRDNHIDSPKSRLSSASKTHQEQRSTDVNNSFSNQTRIKSPNESHENTNQLNNHKLTNENQLTSDSLDHEEQTIFNNNSRSSFHPNEISNDESTVNQQNSTTNSLDVKTDDGDLQQATRRAKPHPSNYYSYFLFCFAIITSMNFQKKIKHLPLQ